MDNILDAVKLFAKNNMRASCFADMEIYVNTMLNIIDGGENIFLEGCVEDLTFQGLKFDEEFVDTMLRAEAKRWLKDYDKHRKDYDIEEIGYEIL